MAVQQSISTRQSTGSGQSWASRLEKARQYQQKVDDLRRLPADILANAWLLQRDGYFRVSPCSSLLPYNVIINIPQK